jgi:hypothetical protein
MIDYLIPLSMIEELLHAVGKVLLEEGEDFRLKYPELLDIYQSLVEDDYIPPARPGGEE